MLIHMHNIQHNTSWTDAKRCWDYLLLYAAKVHLQLQSVPEVLLIYSHILGAAQIYRAVSNVRLFQLWLVALT